MGNIMKIAFDYQIFGFQYYGGISRYIVNLAESLLSSEQDIKIFAPIYRNYYLKDLAAQYPNSVSGQCWKRYPRNTSALISYVNDLVSSKKMATWQPDIIHETYYFRRFYNKPKCPVVVTVHDMIHELFKDPQTTKDKTTALKKHAVNRAQHIICVSNNTKQDLMRLFDIPEAKISVIHLGIDQQQSCNLAITIEKPYLLYVGHRDEYKNFEGLLKAFAQSNRLKQDFDIIAFGSHPFTPKEINYMRSLGIKEGQVKHWQGGDDILAALYQQAEAFVYPSLYEGFGIPPLEAMANGCPVISSHISSMPEVIDDAAEYFDPCLVDTMIHAIERVLYDNDRRAELIKKGAARVKRFTWERCAQQTLSVYQSLLK